MNPTEVGTSVDTAVVPPLEGEEGGGGACSLRGMTAFGGTIVMAPGGVLTSEAGKRESLPPIASV